MMKIKTEKKKKRSLPDILKKMGKFLNIKQKTIRLRI